MKFLIVEEKLFRKIFENEKIVDKIGSYLTFWDICHARESCKLFYRSFSSHLTLFNKKDIRKDYGQHEKYPSEVSVSNLKTYVKFHENPDNFSEHNENPIAFQKFYLNFDLGSASRDSKEDFAIYSSFYGMLKKVKRIKYLRIVIEIEQFLTFVDLFNNHVIEKLDITLLSRLSKNLKVEKLELFKLPFVTKLNLKIDCYEEDMKEVSPVAKSILGSCSDLKEFKFSSKNFSSYEFDILSSSLPMKCLKKIIFYELDFHGFSESGQQLIINFANKFKMAQFSLVCNIFKVENLKWNELQSFFNLFKPELIKKLDDKKLPLFNSVEELKLKLMLNLSNKGVSLSLLQCLKIFPNLTILEINVNNSVKDEKEYLKKLSAEGGTFPNLKELEIYYFSAKNGHRFIMKQASDDDDSESNNDEEGQEEENEDLAEEEVDNNYQPGQEMDEVQDSEDEEEEEGQGQPAQEEEGNGHDENEDNGQMNNEEVHYLEPSDLTKVFPNLLNLKWTGICPQMNFEEIWKNFSKLENFTFSPDLTNGDDDVVAYKMTDEDITGIDQKYIDLHLKGKSYQELFKIKREDLPINKIGIWNLKKLKTLKLSGHEKDLMSQLSYFFGFRLLPHLEVLDIHNTEVTPNVRELLLDINEFNNLKNLNAKYPTISELGIKEIRHKLYCKISPYPNMLTEKEPIFDEKWGRHIFGNHLLLNKIGEFLPLKSALVLRKVSKFWYKHICNQKPSIHIDLNKHSGEIDLEHFMEFYENYILQSKANAIYSINFDKLDNKPSVSVKLFEKQLQCLEKILKMFSLRSLSFNANLKGNGYLRVLKTIQENTYNLQELKITDYEHNPINQTLPLLKSVQKLTLGVIVDDISLKILIDSCPNIKSLNLEDYSRTILDRLAENASKLKNLKILTLREIDYTDEIYPKIIRVAKQFKLEKLILLNNNLKVKGLNWTNIEAFLNIISSQDETLNITFPEVTSFSQSEKKIKSLSRIFSLLPNLTELALKFDDGHNRNADVNFLLEKKNEDEDFSKLEHLKYNFHSNFWLNYEEKICNYFPNLTQLSIKFMLNDSKNAENNFKFNLALIYEGLPKLTKLSFNPIFYFRNAPKMEKLFVSDEDITGIPQKYIEEHLKGKDEEFLKNFDTKNIPGKKIGIETLKDLKYFKMNFEGMTPISIWLGFRQLTKLKSLINELLIMDLCSLALIENEFSELEELDVNFSEFSKKRYSIFKERCPLIRTSKDFWDKEFGLNE